jgi:hypothetical protein
VGQSLLFRSALSASIKVLSCFLDDFYRQGPGNLLMLGKPHGASIPESAFTVKDGKSLNSQQAGLNSAPIFTVSATANLFCWPAIATDSRRNVFLSTSTRYDRFSIAGDSPRRT